MKTSTANVAASGPLAANTKVTRKQSTSMPVTTRLMRGEISSARYFAYALSTSSSGCETAGPTEAALGIEADLEERAVIIFSEDSRQLNKWLRSGWRVKSSTPDNTGESWLVVVTRER